MHGTVHTRVTRYLSSEDSTCIQYSAFVSTLHKYIIVRDNSKVDVKVLVRAHESSISFLFSILAVNAILFFLIPYNH